MSELPVRFEFNQSLAFLHQRTRGQALVELAITLPVLILLVFGAIGLGKVVYSNIVITNAAREGAEYLANNPTGPNLTSVVVNEAQNSGVSVTDYFKVYSSPSTPLPYQPVTVTVQACVTGVYLLNLVSGFPSCGVDGILISKSVSMMVLP